MTERDREAIALVRIIGDAIRDLGEVPSGHLYAHLMSRMNIQTYDAIIGSLKRAGLVTEVNHLLKWVGPKA